MVVVRRTERWNRNSLATLESRKDLEVGHSIASKRRGGLTINKTHRNFFTVSKFAGSNATEAFNNMVSPVLT